MPLPKRIEDMRLARYTGDDSYEMAAAFLGKRWTDIPIETLFTHRESLGALAPAAYRAYLPAYLDASLASDDPLDKYDPDIRHYARDAQALAAPGRRSSSRDSRAPLGPRSGSARRSSTCDAHDL